MTRWLKKWKNEDGQAMAEAAFVLPIITAIFLGIMVFGYIMYAKMVVVDAARDGARHFALGLGDPATLVQTVIDDGQLKTANIDSVTTATSGDYVEVTVKYKQEMWVPGIGLLLGGDRLDDPATCRNCLYLQHTAVFKKEN